MSEYLGLLLSSSLRNGMVQEKEVNILFVQTLHLTCHICVLTIYPKALQYKCNFIQCIELSVHVFDTPKLTGISILASRLFVATDPVY